MDKTQNHWVCWTKRQWKQKLNKNSKIRTMHSVWHLSQRLEEPQINVWGSLSQPQQRFFPQRWFVVLLKVSTVSTYDLLRKLITKSETQHTQAPVQKHFFLSLSFCLHLLRHVSILIKVRRAVTHVGNTEKCCSIRYLKVLCQSKHTDLNPSNRLTLMSAAAAPAWLHRCVPVLPVWPWHTRLGSVPSDSPS